MKYLIIIIKRTANSLHAIGRTSTGTPDQLNAFKSSKFNKLLSRSIWNLDNLLLSASKPIKTSLNN